MIDAIPIPCKSLPIIEIIINDSLVVRNGRLPNKNIDIESIPKPNRI